MPRNLPSIVENIVENDRLSLCHEAEMEYYATNLKCIENTALPLIYTSHYNRKQDNLKHLAVKQKI